MTILSNSTAIALFYPTTQDTVGDGVPDWFKMQYFGSLANGAAADTDADGFTLAQEYLRDYNPTVVDTIVNGGISQRTSPLINNATVYTAYSIISNPSGSCHSTRFFWGRSGRSFKHPIWPPEPTVTCSAIGSSTARANKTVRDIR